MGIGQGIRTGLGHGGITCVSQTQFSSFFFCFFFWRGGGQGNMAIYFKGTLENNSLFLGNKTNVRECLKIILRNRADHKKALFSVSLPTYLLIPYPTHFMALLGNNYSVLVSLLSKNHSSNVRKRMQKYFPAYIPIPKNREGVLQILNLRMTHCLKTLSIIFSNLSTKILRYEMTGYLRKHQHEAKMYL